MKSPLPLIKCCVLLALTGLTGSQTYASPEEWAMRWAANASQPMPEGAKVTLKTDRAEYFLGENVLVDFILENTSDQPFKMSYGGDYRGSSRSLRYIVTATDELGQEAEDPDPSKMNFGGLGGEKEIKPGENYTESLALMRYCRIVKPGRYTIRAVHDFGWKEDDQRKRPVGETVLTFRLPTPDEAEAVVTAVEVSDYADFSYLTYPVYLKPLLQRVEAGDYRTLVSIGGMATREATEALINLSLNANPELARTAINLLVMRMPNPANAGGGFWNSPPFTREFRQHLAEQSWDAAFAPTLRALATNLLTRTGAPRTTPGMNSNASGYFLRDDSSESEVATGAKIISLIGELEDADAVLAAMDRALNPMINPRRDPKDNITDLPQPLRELLNTMNALKGKGYAPPTRWSSGASGLLYFTWLANEPEPRPARWLDILKIFGGDQSRYPGRIAALNSIPKPLPDECVDFVMERLSDKDLGVCLVACRIAGDSRNSVFLQPLLDIVATEHHEWLFRQAVESAKKLGAGYELLDILADRLNEELISSDARTYLTVAIFEDCPSGIVFQRTSTRSRRLAVRNVWKTFLTEHADEIKQGKKFKTTDPTLPPELIGRSN